MKIVFILFALLQIYAQAAEYSSTNVQLLRGFDFDKVAGGDSVPGGDMTTITLEHASGWKYGSNFFFVDLTSAKFASKKTSKIYGEWAPKISFSKLSSKEISFAIVKDVGVAAEINQGDNFRAYNIGLGLSLGIPKFTFFDLNMFRRDDNFNKQTYQLTLAWLSEFEIATLPFRFEGFFDYYGVDFGTEIVSQPRLMIDGKFFSSDFKNLQAGVELYCYRSSATSSRPTIKEAVPQGIIKWVW